MNFSLSLTRFLRQSSLLCRIRFGVRIPSRVIPSLWDQTTLLLRDSLKTQTRPGIAILEMGTGQSALLLCWLAKTYPRYGLKLVGADINSDFVENARKVAATNQAKVEIIESNLFSCIEERYELILINPPYVPSTHPAAPKEGTAPLDTTWNGGAKGTDIIKAFLESAHKYLAKDGVILLGVNQFYVKSKETEKLIVANGYRILHTVEKTGNLSIVYAISFGSQ